MGKKRLILALIIIVVFLFIGNSYIIITKLGSDLVGAEGVPIEELEIYKTYGEKRRLLNRKIKALEKEVIVEVDECGDEEIVEDMEEVEQEKGTATEPENKEGYTGIVEEEINDIEEENTENIEVGELWPTEGSEERKVAYLTFDDGPSSTVTPQILDILAKYDIKATFFVVGKYAEKYPHILKRIHDEGHVIGNHTYSHNYNYIYKNVSNFVKELDATKEVFKNILGEDFETDLIRFPGGSFEAWKTSFRKQVTELGYRYVDWNSLNGDAEGHNLSKERLIERFKSTYKKQNNLVILMHDTDEKYTTPEALPAIIEFLIEEGYEFSTL